MKNLCAETITSEIIGHKYLTFKEVTGSITGYPSPYLGIIVHGFKTFDEAIEFQHEYGGSIQAAKWYNGWHFCNLIGNAYEPFDNSLLSEEMGCNYSSMLVKDANAQWVLDEIENAILNADDEEDIASLIQYKIESCREILSYIQNWDDNDVIMFHEGIFENIYPANSMESSYDTKNFVIGVFFEKDEL